MSNAVLDTRKSILQSLPDIVFSSSDESSCLETPRAEEVTPKGRSLDRSLGEARNAACARKGKEQDDCASERPKGKPVTETIKRSELAVLPGKAVDLQKSAEAGEKLAARESLAKIFNLKKQLAEQQHMVADQERALVKLQKEEAVLRAKLTWMEDEERHSCAVRKELHREIVHLRKKLALEEDNKQSLKHENQALLHQLQRMEQLRTEHQRHTRRFWRAAGEATALAEGAQRRLAVVESEIAEARNACEQQRAGNLTAQLVAAKRSAAKYKTIGIRLKAKLENKRAELHRLKASQLEGVERRRKRPRLKEKEKRVNPLLVQSLPDLDFIARRSAARNNWRGPVIRKNEAVSTLHASQLLQSEEDLQVALRALREEELRLQEAFHGLKVDH